MRARAALLLGAAALSCSDGRRGGSEGLMSSTTQGAVVRRTTVKLPAGEAGADLEGRRGFLAAQRCALRADGRWLACQLPPLGADGQHRVALADLAATPPAVTLTPGVLAPGGAAVVVGPDGPRLVDGPALPVGADASLGPPEYVEASWHAPLAAAEPLLRLATIRDAGRWALEAYDAGGATRRWRTGAAELPGEPSGIALAPDGAAVFLALRQRRDGAAYELVALDGAEGTTRWRVPLSAAPSRMLPPAPDGAGLALVAREPARCESCAKLVVVSPGDGRVVREVALAAGTIATEATSAGLAGERAWFYRYVPAHATSELAPGGRTRVPASCEYEAHDLRAAGHPPATLRDAEGDWRTVAGACEVRALIPLAGGRVAAIQVVGEDELTVVELDAAP